MKVEIDLPEIEGYEYTGEYRPPKDGECYLGREHTAKKATFNYDDRHLILRHKRWRAEKGGDYYYFDSHLEMRQTNDIRTAIDNQFYDAGNYFQTKEQCQQAIDKIKEVLK